MEKLKYETPEMEIMMLDPTMDIITASGEEVGKPGLPGTGIDGEVPGIDW